MLDVSIVSPKHSAGILRPPPATPHEQTTYADSILVPVHTLKLSSLGPQREGISNAAAGAVRLLFARDSEQQIPAPQNPTFPAYAFSRRREG